ncbi:unnamed protein product [Orchesella dallaii]|uniref:Uncharacterized protein n=1 Tax=Orchesella dallaii TaxID=48710 RepID=A0ABP1RN48_9HEXA
MSLTEFVDLTQDSDEDMPISTVKPSSLKRNCKCEQYLRRCFEVLDEKTELAQTNVALKCENYLLRQRISEYEEERKKSDKLKRAETIQQQKVVPNKTSATRKKKPLSSVKSRPGPTLRTRKLVAGSQEPSAKKGRKVAKS